MTRKSVNYDALAPTYNLRFADGKSPQTARALETLAHRYHAHHILEVGCGTGRWIAELSDIAEHCYGLDLSAGMLAQAQARNSRVHLTRGRGELLPFPDGAFDMVYCVNAIHHFAGQYIFIQEAGRVLRPGGILAIIGMDPRGRRDSWYVYDYFDGTYQTDIARFPSWETVLNWMTCTGFQQVRRQIVETIVDRKVGRAVLDDLFLKKHATSQLALLSDEAYLLGLKRLETAIATAETSGKEIIFQVDIVMEMLSGQRP